MRFALRRSLFVVALSASLYGVAVPGWANPVSVGPPPLIDGTPVPMPTVKKWGQYWYPASLVGHNRGIDFAFDHATNTLYADGSVLDLQTLVVEGIVYIPLQPNVTATDLRPGLSMLEAKRADYEASEKSMPERVGNTEALFMETTVDMPEHPWAESPTSVPTGPVIDLEPTGTAHVPAHLRPGALPSQAPPQALPGRLPKPAVVPVAVLPVESPPAAGIPLRVATEGGPQASTRRVEDSTRGAEASTPETPPISNSAAGLQPIPQAVSAPAASPVEGRASAINPSKGKNQAFEVSVLSGSLKSSSSDRLLALKLHQKNLSPVAQANLGTFALRCQDGSRVEPVKSRSVMPDGTLAPGGVREGELLFRLAPGAQPTALELEGTLPLSVTLAR